MPNVSEKKLKLLYIAQILLERTDSEHAVTLPQMMEELEAKGLQAERKSLYDDIETLRHFGFPIETRKTRSFSYYLAQRPFSQEDLSQLGEAVRQAPFLSPRRVAQLLKKLASLGSRYQGELLLHPTGAAACEEPSLKESPSEASSAELLQAAMEQNRQVSFQAVFWELSSSGSLRRTFKTITASPWRLFRREGALWLTAYDSGAQSLGEYPVEQLSQVRTVPQPRVGEFALPSEEKLTLEFSQELLPQVAAYFDGRLTVEPLPKGRLRGFVKAPVDDSLLAWLFAGGRDVRLTAPKKAAEQLREQAKALAKAYKL